MIINIFLIPVISLCRKNVVTKVYTDIIDFILKTVNENLLANDSAKVYHLYTLVYYEIDKSIY